MNAKMTFNTRATCPIDGERIDYAVTASVVYLEPWPGAILKVEAFKQIVFKATEKPILQEDLTLTVSQLLVDYIESHGISVNSLNVATVGTHSGVHLSCEA